MVSPSPLVQIKVLIADDDNQLSRRLAAHLGDNGFEVRTTANGMDARQIILDWSPKFVLADLMLPDGNALELIDYIRGEKRLRHQLIHVAVMSGHNTVQNVKMCFQRGAKDYIVKPFRHDDVLKRLVFLSRNYRSVSDINAKDYNKFDEASLTLHLTDLVLRQALGTTGLEDVLYNLTRMLSLKVDGVRCSIVQCLDQKAGVVVTSNDDRTASGIQVDLYKYPEIVHVMNTNKLIAIENLDETPDLRHIKEKMQDIAFNSMIVCPLQRRGEFFGVLSLRLPPEKKVISDNEIRFVEVVSHTVSLVLGNELHKAADNYWLQKPRSAVISFPIKK